jgi:hypothetical protein
MENNGLVETSLPIRLLQHETKNFKLITMLNKGNQMFRLLLLLVGSTTDRCFVNPHEVSTLRCKMSRTLKLSPTLARMVQSGTPNNFTI